MHIANQLIMSGLFRRRTSSVLSGPKENGQGTHKRCLAEEQLVVFLFSMTLFGRTRDPLTNFELVTNFEKAVI